MTISKRHFGFTFQIMAPIFLFARLINTKFHMIEVVRGIVVKTTNNVHRLIAPCKIKVVCDWAKKSRCWTNAVKGKKERTRAYKKRKVASAQTTSYDGHSKHLFIRR